MIGALLDALGGRVQRADAVIKTDDTLTLAISPEGDTRVTSSRTQTHHLRILHEGRVGYATGSGGSPGLLAEQALTAAASGPELELHLPMPAPLPVVALRAPSAAAADVPALDALARILFERLQRSERRVEVWVERSAGSVRVGNTRGVLAGYEATLGGAGAVVESIGAGYAPPCRVHTVSSGLPGLPELETIVSEVDRRLEPPILPPTRFPSQAMPVCLAPRAVATFLRPLRAALAGQAAWLGGSPLRDRLGGGERVFDEKLTVSDDPLAPGRPGSRPIDDDGVVSRRLPLIERGRLVGFLADLEVGSRARVPSTGHGWRRPVAGSRVGFTNLRVAPGIETRATLLTMMGRGVVVEDLEWGSGPNPLRGTLALRAPWCYLVENGMVRGRLEGAVLRGDLFRVLTRIGAVGGDATWIGAAWVPSLLVEGLTVTGDR